MISLARGQLWPQMLHIIARHDVSELQHLAVQHYVQASHAGCMHFYYEHTKVCRLTGVRSVGVHMAGVEQGC